MINKTIMNFLSNKINILIIIGMCYFIIGYTWTYYNIPLKHQIMMWIVMVIIAFLIHLLGVGRGMFLAAVHKDNIDAFMKLIKPEEDDDEE